MTRPDLAERMDNIERIVEPLRALPDRVTRVESQIVQLRTEMRGEFSAIRRDMATKDDVAKCATKEDVAKCATREDLAKCATKEELAKCSTREDLARYATKEDLANLATRDDLARLGRGLRRQTQGLHTRMLVLHEDLVQRLKVIGEALPRAARGRAKPS
jgi:hypothetical protein